MSSKYPNISIKLNGEDYILEKIYVSELNWIMIRLYNNRTKTYITQNIGQYNNEDNFIVDELRRHRKEIK